MLKQILSKGSLSVALEQLIEKDLCCHIFYFHLNPRLHAEYMQSADKCRIKKW